MKVSELKAFLETVDEDLEILNGLPPGRDHEIDSVYEIDYIGHPYLIIQ